MTRWTIAANSRPEFKYGTVYVYDEPLWLALLGWFVAYILSHGFSLLSKIPLPNWFPRKRDDRSDELYTLKEWYGTVGDLFHLAVYNPIFQWQYAQSAKHEISIEIGYDRLKELFGKTHADFFAMEKGLEDDDDDD